MSTQQEQKVDGWFIITPPFNGPVNANEFPMWLAKSDTGQVHFWHSQSGMARCEPLWTAYTHWKPAKDDIPSPPGGFGAINLQKRREDERRAYIQGFDAGVKLCQDKLRGVGQLNPNLL